MKKILFLIAMTAILVPGIKAQDGPARVPAYPGIIEHVQPNGDTLRTYLRGDEWMHWMMTDDGWQIQETPKGWYRYAKKDRKGNIVASKRKAHNPEKRSKCEKRWLEKNGIKKHI
jgi:hypothetical protein